MKFPDLESLYVAVGEGHVSPQSVVARLARLLSGTPEDDVTEVPLARPVRLGQAGRGRPGRRWCAGSRTCGCASAGAARRCPATRSWGSSRAGRASPSTAPTARTRRTLQREPERLIEVTWAEGKPTSFVVAVQVEALDRTRLLSDVATVLSDNHVNILSATSATGRDRITRLRFTFELADIAHLSSVLASVKRVESVFDAYRVVPAEPCGSSSSGSAAPR